MECPSYVMSELEIRNTDVIDRTVPNVGTSLSSKYTRKRGREGIILLLL